jgi:tRNA (adenine57-N1/adenine58-N1)-methyltransferase catalytic subunit
MNLIIFIYNNISHKSMIKRILIQKEKRVYVEEQERERIIRDQKMYFVEDISKDFHTSDGVFTKEELQKTDAFVKSNKGEEFYIIESSFIDSYKGIKKQAQTIPLKDLGYILSELGINKKTVIVDTGSGSGGAACLLAMHCKKVYSFDVDEKNLSQAKENAEYFGLKNIIFKKQDSYKSIPVKDADVVLFDLPSPWNAIENAYKALKHGGFLVTYCPQITQTQRVVNVCLEKGFIHVKTSEIVERPWKIEGNIVKPISLSNIHSGFISIMRKIN